MAKQGQQEVALHALHLLLYILQAQMASGCGRLGKCGLISYAVSQRRREIGIRSTAALGSYIPHSAATILQRFLLRWKGRSHK